MSRLQKCLLPFVFVPMMGLAGCSGSGSGGGAAVTPTPTPAVTHVYLAGEVNTGTASIYVPKAEVWTDGVGAELSTTATQSGVHGITLMGSDVYAGGWQGDGTNNQAMIWKNGASTRITTGTGYSEIFGIASSASDIYATGVVVNASGYGVATLWKNGVPSPLADTGIGSSAYGVAVSGSDVYVTGYVYAFYNQAGTQGSAGFAALWKNGTLTYLSGQQYSSIGYAIAVSNGDVYVAGDADLVPGVTVGQPVYWKNGSLVQLSTNNGQAYSLVVSGSDVYVGGDVYLPNKNTGINLAYGDATVWKNGTATDYNNAAIRSGTPSIAVSGGSVYAAGGMLTTQGYEGGYWKDGVLTVLPPGDVAGEAIVVIQE